MTGDELRQRFLDFFEQRAHQRMPSASLIPAADPTLLLTSAGMVPFKPYFTGEMAPPSPRLTSCQKCFRTTDIDEVGDSTHLTFFEMLGNFSVGDYFKREAIAWALEFVTSPSEGLDLPQERFAITVFQDDDEAIELWKQAGIPQERIYRFGEDHNWWGPAGNEGPCGPCSELHYDFGPHRGCRQPNCGPNCANSTATGQPCDRFVELWNLVFMQFYQDPQGQRTPLPKPNIDTGMGLERTAVVMQGVANVYETDLFAPIVQRVAELAGRPYGQSLATDIAIRVVAEHARSAAFLIADGVTPTPDDRGSVLRKVLRRALVSARKLGLGQGEPVLPQVAQIVIDHMGPTYPELVEKRAFIVETLRQWEEGWQRLIEMGGSLFDEFLTYRQEVSTALQDAQKVATAYSQTSQPVQFLGGLSTQLERLQSRIRANGVWWESWQQAGFPTILKDVQQLLKSVESIPAGRWSSNTIEQANVLAQYLRGAIERFLGPTLSGRQAFYLHDTLGFPIEETQAIARQRGWEVDPGGFEREMEDKSKKDRATVQLAGVIHGATYVADALRAYQALNVGQVRFLGYDTLEANSSVAALLKDGAPVDSASAGDRVEVILKETPFYAEGGGQAGDRGELRGPRGRVRVEDTRAPLMGLNVHYGAVVEGTLRVGETVHAQVDPQHRLGCARNHTATHLLHAALRQVLGAHVRQAGSLVAPDRLRFDYTHMAPLSREELERVQRLVNDKVRQNVPVTKRETSYTQAIADGALAFFGDKYGDRVRVVEMNSVAPFSREVCGGTHLSATGEVGHFQVLWEGSIGSGMRRVEAVTGVRAEEVVWERIRALDSVAQRLQAPTPLEAEERAASLLEDLDRERKRVAALERELARRQAAALPEQAQEIKGLKVLAAQVTASSEDVLRETGDWLRDKLGGGVIALGAVLEDRPILIVMAAPDAVRRGIHAGNLAREVGREMGGGGGGRPELGQAGGKSREKLAAALERVAQLVEREVKG